MSGWNQRPRSFTTVILDLDFVATMIACLHAIGFNAIQRNYRRSRNHRSSSCRIFFRRALSKYDYVVSIFHEIRIDPRCFFFFLLYDLVFFGIQKIDTRSIIFFLKIALRRITSNFEESLFIIMGLCLLNLYELSLIEMIQILLVMMELSWI